LFAVGSWGLGHAQDQHGELRDLVIMSYFTGDFLTQTSE
jgi:hypothetical protein